jgi:acyl-CoA thioesterase
MTDLTRARGIFSADRFASECTGITIEAVSPGYARCRLEIQPRHCNALGNPMGGAIFTLADFAFAVASNFQRSVTVAQAAQITYLAAAKGTVLFAEAREVRSGHSTCFFQADITDEFGTKVAFFTGNGFIIRQDTPKES